jgi:hypothetical protein
MLGPKKPGQASPSSIADRKTHKSLSDQKAGRHPLGGVGDTSPPCRIGGDGRRDDVIEEDIVSAARSVKVAGK